MRSQKELIQESPPVESHYVYIVCCANDSFYTGYTKDIEQRIVAHNAGKGGRYTRSHRPVALVASWRFPTKRSAMQVEYQIKQMSRSRKVEIVDGRELPPWTCGDEL